MGFLAHLNPSLDKDLLLREEIKIPQKAHLNGSKGDPQKGIFLAPKMSFSQFSKLDFCS